jgi:hypothetical protein
MTILDRLFHPRGRDAPPSSAPDTGAGPGPREADNRGTRHDTLDKATAYWIARMGDPHKDPFVVDTFASEAEARAALLELPCIHEAVDTGNLICSEVLIFGYYPTEAARFEAIVCGRDLGHELWEQARDAFARHGGQRKNELEPEASAAPTPVAAAPAPSGGSVVFEREEHVERMGATFTYRIHHAPDAASAKAFLGGHPVSQARLYLIVNTPEGTYCRDIDGMYRE